MSKALKCDICGSFYDGIPSLGSMKKTTRPNRLSIYYRSDNGNTTDDCFLDICPDCYAAIKKTIDARRKRKDPFDDDLK